MKEIIAYCGINCAECPIYIATQDNDEKLRKETAEKYELKLEDCYCDGCGGDGKRIAAFCNKCEVRTCATNKKLENCAYCDDYPCELLNKLHEMYNANNAKSRLKAIRKDLRR
jgi:hypothetical protein